MATGMPVSEFSGAEAAGDANQYIVAHGFPIIEVRRRNPTWVRDELILALDMYLRTAGNPPRKGSSEMVFALQHVGDHHLGAFARACAPWLPLPPRTA
jgi:hypothetical protein